MLYYTSICIKQNISFKTVIILLFRVFCSKPETISLKPLLPSIEGKKCPTSGENLVNIYVIHSMESFY